MSGTNVLTDR